MKSYTYFTEIKDMQELKKQYKRLALQHHEDRGGSKSIMQEINAEYEEIKKTLEIDEKIKDSFKEIISNLMKYSGIDIDIVGEWIWIEGETISIKEDLKAMGFRWSGKRKKWYYRPEDGKRRKSSGLTFEEIQKKYGHEHLETKKNYKLA